MDFFATYMPHGHCYLWTPSILWTHVASDVVIAASYFSIPATLLYFVRKREDLPFSWVFVLFGVFILACGTGHVVDVWNTWNGYYGLEGVVKAITAMASVGTAIAIWFLLPRALTLPSASELEQANEALRSEVAQREQAELELRQRGRELEDARDAAQEASRTKSQFLANMSHEIRTPLNAVIGLSEVLLRTELNPYQRDHMRTIAESGEHLLGVINDILDFSKIEAGRIQVERVPFNLEDLVGDTLRSLSLRAEARRLELVLGIDADVPRLLRGDPGRLRQVIMNLVSNAITFTEEGEVVVRVTRDDAADDLGQDQLRLHFSVRDTGIGIEPSHLERLFQSFEQADTSTTRRYGGTGLGLSICTGLVELMGGEIGAESVPHEGSTFHFTALFEVAGEAQPLADRETVPLEGTGVLIVDDNPTNRIILHELARRRGMLPVLASSADEGFALLRQGARRGDRVPLVLTDLHMPREDGFALAERIRADEALRETEIVVLTSATRPSDRGRCEELRIAQMLLKPVKEYELLGVIERVLGQPGIADRATGPEAALDVVVSKPKGGAMASTPEIRTSPKKILLVEDSIPNQKVALAILQAHDHEVVVANDGHEAVEKFASGGFDLVLMDVQMPKMDGYETTAALRAAGAEGARTPIIAMTAHALRGDREKCIAAGMDDYIAKPIRRDELFRAISRAVETRPGVVDWSGPLSQVDGNREVLRDIVGAYAAEVREHLERLPAAIQGADWPEARRRAHSLKSAMRMFGVADAQRIGQQLENIAAEGDPDGEAAELFETLAAAAERALPELDRFAATGEFEAA